MILVVDGLFEPQELAWLRGLYAECEAEDGARTADGALKQVKHNHQLVLGERVGEIRAHTLEAFNRHPFLHYALLPKTVSAPLLNVYRPGMSYGNHTDAHLGRMGERYFRCDISCTIFFDEPSAYEGGELCIRTERGEQTYKLPAGSGVFYPTHYVHRVNEITSGERRALVMWFESFVRDPARRAMLFELQQLRSWIEEREPAESDVRASAVNVCENLHRMWVEP